MRWVDIAILANLVATWWMVGLIWFVQVVHYPLMGAVGTEKFSAYEQAHTRLTTFVVGPAMLIEAFTAIALIYLRPKSVEAYWLWIGLFLIFAIWITTAVCSVPMHSRLEKGFDESAHRWLVQSNWLRTIGWSLRGALVSWMTWQFFSR